MRRSVRDAIVGFTLIGSIIGFASTALWLRGVRLGSSHWSLTARFSDAETLAFIKEMRERSGYIMDPHTAIGALAGRAFQEDGVAMVVAATAHPAKFGEAIQKATGNSPEIPARLAQVFKKEERFKVLPNNAQMVKAEVHQLVETLR